MRKIISLMSAAAIASSLLVVPISANAEEFYTFDGSSTTGWSLTNGNVTMMTDDMGEYLQIQGSGSGNRTGSFTLPVTLDDDYVIEFDTMLTRGNGMGRTMHTTQIAFTNDTTTMDTRDGAGIFEEINTALGTNYKEGAGSSIANAALKIDLRPYDANKWMINDDSTSDLVAFPETAVAVSDSTWVRVQAVVSGTTTTVNVIDSAGTKIVDNQAYTNSGSGLSSIYMCSGRGDQGSGIIALDNIKIYDGDVVALTTDGLRGAVEAPTPKPSVPQTVPEGTTVQAAADFEDLANDTRVYVTNGEAMSMTSGDFTISAGTAKDTRSETNATVRTYFYGEDNSSTNILSMAEGNFASAARGPIIKSTELKSVGADGTLHEVFAMRLNASDGTTTPSLFLVDTTESYLGSDNQYKYVLARLTTNETLDEGDSDTVAVVEPDKWVVVDFALSADGSYTVSVDGEELIAHDGAVEYTATDKITVKNAPSLVMNVLKGDTTANGTVVSIDNLAVYGASDGTETPDPGETTSPEATTAPTSPKKAAAPALTAHASAVNLYTQNFDAATVGSGLTLSTEDQGAYTDIEGLSITVGSRNREGSTGESDPRTSALVTENIAGDNAVTITGGRFGVNANSARVALADNLSIAEDDTLTSIMGFAFQVTNQAGGVAKLYLVNNVSNTDTNGTPREVLAVFTANGDADSIANGDDKIGVEVTAGEWHTAAIAVSADAYRVYLDGNYENPVVKASKTGSGNTTYSVQNLPTFAATNGKDANYSVVTVDNIVAYQIETSFEKKYLPTVSIPETWTKYDATYADGRLTNVTMTAVADPSTVDTSANTDTAKTFVWNNEMKPYVAE